MYLGDASGEHFEMAGRKLLSRFRRCVCGALCWTHRRMEAAFFSLGCFVTDHSVVVLIVSLVLAVGLSSGISRIKPEDRYERLWSTPGSAVDSANAAYAKYFATSSHPAQIIVTSKNGVGDGDGGNVLTGEILLETLRLHENVLLKLSDGLRDQCQPLDVFLRRTKVAERSSLLQNQSLDVTECANIAGVLSTFRYRADDIRSAWSNISDAILHFYTRGNLRRQPLAQFVGEVGIPAGNRLKTSPAIRLLYSIDGALGSDFNFDKEFVDAVEAFSSTSRLISATCLGPASLDRETERSLSSDFWLVSICAAILIIFSVLNTGSVILCDPVHSRTLIGLCGMLNVALALGASIGLATYCGVIFSAIQVAMICVVLAIGVDDMFVLCDALTRQDRSLPLRERVGGALKQVGASIAMTSTTDAVTFALVAINAVPGVEAFAINATIAIIFDFLLQVTFFMACLALDEKRTDSGRWDILCCRKVKNADATTPAGSNSTSSACSPTHGSQQRLQPSPDCANPDMNKRELGKVMVTNLSQEPGPTLNCFAKTATHGTSSSTSCDYKPGEKLLTYLFREKYAPTVINSRCLHIVALLGAIALCGYSFYGVTQVSSELQLSDTLVDDSFVLKYQKQEKRYFSAVALQVSKVRGV